MKKILSLLAILMMAMTSWAQTAINVSTAQEFYDAVISIKDDAEHTKCVKLSNDIDLSSLSVETEYIFQSEFKGMIDGNGHTLMKSTKPLFYQLTGAKITNLNLFNFTITNSKSVLACTSSGSLFESINARYCTIKDNRNNRNDNFGIMTGDSKGDKYTRCTVDAASSITVKNEFNIGGIAGWARASVFSYCKNAAKIDTEGGEVGGIVGTIEYGSQQNIVIENCLNTGEVNGEVYVGGIAGSAGDATFKKCVNTGALGTLDSSTMTTFRGGILGRSIGNVTVTECLNFGSINHSQYQQEYEKEAAIVGDKKDSTSDPQITDCYYSCNINGRWYCSFGSYTIEEVEGGKFAYEKTFYQDIDNNAFETHNPVPIAAAGTVNSNILCDGTQSYSNIYSSTGSHTSNTDVFGMCTTCGKQIGTASSEIHITNASDLTKLAHNVNSGMDLSGKTIYLDNDIDMSGVTYSPIGGSFSTPFKGTFDGQGHRINNMTIYTSNSCAGLFGCVAGTSTIKNLVIDNSCKIYGSGYGAAGIVGCLALPEESSSESIFFTMDACGNEANVNGDINAAGLIGGVYNTDTNGNASVLITNSYNTGNITGNRESAAFIGYGNKTVSAANCFNTGVVKGFDADHSLLRCKDYSDLSVSKVYNLSTLANDVKATTFTALELATGKLCYDLATEKWSQNIGTDAHPDLSGAGLRHARTMGNQWGTICLPYAIQSNEDVQLYTLTSVTTGEGDTMVFTPNDEVVAANTPCVFKKKNAEDTSVTFPAGNDAVTIAGSPSVATGVAGWTMKGTYTNLENQTGIYFIADDKFWQAQTPITIAPFRAWFETSTSSPAKAFSIVLDEETTGINEVSGEGLEVREEKYLENGKVVIVRNGRKYNINGQAVL